MLNTFLTFNMKYKLSISPRQTGSMILTVKVILPSSCGRNRC